MVVNQLELESVGQRLAHFAHVQLARIIIAPDVNISGIMCLCSTLYVIVIYTKYNHLPLDTSLLGPSTCSRRTP